ncbi:hypothetical protein PFLUV_G00073470 [Perca fluviatilis]|uniref:Uncharacterized protein n=1 Tax=Perca fluviatilis TaxID=8168 RepID=A0A6A5FKL4_PERFL|nr:uncharacterized protein LOC120559977 [Perca fluviatilis]KAF1389442.1 hypothetical protein PFLUV_G00073470 [Perca fluviatilis]
MASVDYLREFVNERLTAAAEEIFGVFKKTIVEYEEEIGRQRRLLDVVRKPEIKLQIIELPQQHISKEEEEVPAEQQLCIQERSSSLNQEEPEPPQIKEEQEELCTSQEEHSSIDSNSGAVASLVLSLNSWSSLNIPSPSTQSTPEMSVTALPNRPWYTNFRVDWDRMPTGIRTAALSLTRPSPPDRREMVKAVVDQMREHDLNPSRAVCHNIVRNIIREYPRSFADVDRNGEFVGDGCSSLLLQIKTRVEYKNRNNPLSRRRRKRRSDSEGRTLSRGPVDQYGCVRWEPSDLPSGETEATLEDVRRQMVTIHSEEGMAGAERAVKLLEKTYTIQRRYLNMTPPPAISDVKKQWPFLFAQRGMFSHFLHLTDISVVAKLTEAMERKGDTILKLCHKLNKNPGVEEVLANYEPNTAEDKAVCIILLLLAYFKEARDAIILQADPFSTAANIQRTLTLPSTPRLIVSGEVMKPRAWMLSIEGQVVMGPHANFINGIAAVFASYYNFNLQYPEEAACTLEFIQRCFLGINPENGSKAEKARGGINPHVCTLMRKLMDLEWMSM